MSGLLLIALILSGCGPYESKDDYFNGTVLVEYYQTKTAGENDNVTLTFYEKGSYDIKFACTPNTRCNTTPPEDFTVDIQDIPRTRVITQYILPNFLDITITYDGVSETHSFK